MTLEDLKDRWPGWTFTRRHFRAGDEMLRCYVHAELHDDCARSVTCVGPASTDEEGAYESLDRWMWRHIKRPRSREAAEGAEKGGAR